MSRYFVRFTEEAERSMVMSTLAPTAPESDRPYPARRDNHLLIADLGPEEVASARESGAEVFEDVRFEEVVQDPLLRGRGPSWPYWEPQADTLAPAAIQVTQADVMNHIRAPEAWEISRGAGVTIAIVDTGIAGGRPEFPPQKRSARSVSFAFAEPWQDIKGHGSMCASAAAATTAAGGRFNGVAPDAELLSARTTLFSTDLYKLYDQLIDDREHGLLGPLVISNSYGLYRCDPPPGLPEDHPYLGLVREAVANGIVVVFAAGNNHADVLCNHDPDASTPNSIWAVNSVDEVLTVGTVNADNSNQVGAHANSSRGPGQWAVQRPKPDVVAPTYGEIVWGNGYRVMEWWGTSGACPQVAGLAALILSVNPPLQPAQVGDIIRSTARPLPAAQECVGAGLIDCRAAVDAAGT
jgi:serine protease AprX